MSKSNQHKDRLKLQRNCDYDLSFEVKDEETQINEELNFDIEILDKLTEIEEKMIVDREMYRECTYDMLWRNECQMELGKIVCICVKNISSLHFPLFTFIDIFSA